MQPSSDQSPSFDPWLQSMTWLIFAPLALLGGCFVGMVVLRLSVPLVVAANNASWPQRAVHILMSIAAGSCMAILLAILWFRLLRRTDLWWIIGNMFAMSGTVYTILLLLPNTVNGDSLPLGWLPSTVGIGIGLSILHWAFLRSRTRQAIWWIPLMSGSWTLVWLLVVGLAVVVGD